jgi:hypothetical protein
MFRSAPQRACAQLKAVTVCWDVRREVVLDPRIDRLLKLSNVSLFQDSIVTVYMKT